MIGLSKVSALKVLKADNNEVIRGSDGNKVNKTVKNLSKSKSQNNYKIV